MDDYISRQAEIEALENKAHLEWGYLRVAMPLLKTLETIPAADVAPVVHAYWRDTGSGQECSACKEIQYGYDTGRYFCANCGAKMDGERKE